MYPSLRSHARTLQEPGDQRIPARTTNASTTLESAGFLGWTQRWFGLVVVRLVSGNQRVLDYLSAVPGHIVSIGLHCASLNPCLW